MALYNNKNTASQIARVEFAPVAEGNFSFFSVDKMENKDAAKQFLIKEVGQKIISDTVVGGKPMLVGHGGKTPDEIIKLLTERGDKLVLEPPLEKSMDTWKLIAMLAVPGQMMQMASSLTQVGKKLDWGLFVFAASNLLGHVIGWSYGSQKTNDWHRLDYAKQHFNEKIGPHVPPSVQLPNIEEDRSSLRDEPTGPKTQWQKTNDFLRKNSVSFGEIFLRYFGAFALAFPVNRWKSTAIAIRKGESLGQIWKKAANPGTVFYTGALSMFGKTVALFSKVPDPYDPKPHSWLDTIREKYAFRTGGWIESLAFGIMAHDAMTDQKRKIRFGDRETRDWLGIVGASMFTVRYMVRHWAKYGEKSFDMEELRAHVTDSLAMMPHGKLPQLLGDTAADLTDHFKDKKLRFGEVYMQLRSEMQRYHSYHSYYGAPPNRPEPDSFLANPGGPLAKAAGQQEYMDMVHKRKEVQPYEKDQKIQPALAGYAGKRTEEKAQTAGKPQAI